MITRAPRLTTGFQVALQDRVNRHKERNVPQPTTRGIIRKPIDKYTKGDMPQVHDLEPTSTLNLIDIDQIVEWENYQNGKLLAIPFSIEAQNIDNHDNIGDRILTAAGEITQTPNLGISTPIPSEAATVEIGDIPTSFLIYNLSNKNIDTLMQRRVWSSSAITFRVADLHPPRPDFLFTIKGFKTGDETSIRMMVKATWQNDDAQNIIEDITAPFTEECQTEVRENLKAFLASVYVKLLKYRNKGSLEAPRYNIYAKSKYLFDDDIWFHLRDSLAALPYTAPMQGRGTTEIPSNTCAICHGADHPTGLCDFPEMSGWNGPTRISIARANQQKEGRYNRGMRNDHQMRS